MSTDRDQRSSWDEVSATAREEAQRYRYEVFYSPEDESFIGRVVEWPSLSAHGETFDEAAHEIQFVVAASIDDCVDQGDEYPEPLSARSFSGKFSVRIPPTLHRELVAEAARQGVSLNQLVNLRLSARRAG